MVGKRPYKTTIEVKVTIDVHSMADRPGRADKKALWVGKQLYRELEGTMEEYTDKVGDLVWAEGRKKSGEVTIVEHSSDDVDPGIAEDMYRFHDEGR